jgi:hypothetical protein
MKSLIALAVVCIATIATAAVFVWSPPVPYHGSPALWQDPETGCEYLMGGGGVWTPRIADQYGRHLCRQAAAPNPKQP